MANEPDLSRLILDAKGERSYERMSTDCGGNPTSKRLQQMATGPLKAFPDAETLEGVARGTGTSLTTVVLSAARSLGLRVYASQDPDAFVIGDAGALRPDQLEATRVLVRSFQASNRAMRLEAWNRARQQLEKSMRSIDDEEWLERSPLDDSFGRLKAFARLQADMESYVAASAGLRDGDLSSDEQAHLEGMWDHLAAMIEMYAAAGHPRPREALGDLSKLDARSVVALEERIRDFIKNVGPTTKPWRGNTDESPPPGLVVDLFQEAAHTPQDPPGAGEHGEP